MTDFKLRFYGSVLGYVWTLARPFMFFGVIYFVFTEIVGLDKNVPNYGVYILFALVLFQFFGEATGNCGRLRWSARENLLRKMRFPRLVIPLAVVLTALFNLGMTLIAVFIFAIASGVDPTWTLARAAGDHRRCWRCFATGVGLLLSALFVRYRDVQPIWEVISQMLFYASPVLYVVDDGARELPARLPGQPDRGAADRDAPRGRRPDRAAGVGGDRRRRSGC